MPTVTVPTGTPPASVNTFEVINANTVRYEGVLYHDVTTITYPDGSTKTCAEIIEEAGGAAYLPSDLKRCVKVEGYERASGSRNIFTLYSNNSRQTSKNVTANIPGGAWVEMFDFLGDAESNHVIDLWRQQYEGVVPDYTELYQTTWIGFKIAYGESERRSYVLTQSNQFGEESAPSLPVEIGVTHMHYVRLSGSYAPPQSFSAGGATHKYVPIVAFNLYRSAYTSGGIAQYQRVPVSPVHTAYVFFGGSPALTDFPTQATNEAEVYLYRFDDIVETSGELGVLLPSVDWDRPEPRECMQLTEWRNGIVACFWKNTVKFSEPYRPFTFPSKYFVTLPHDILGMKADENALFVITTGGPYLFMGSHPSNVTYEQMHDALPGIAGSLTSGGVTSPSRGMARTPSGIVYQTYDGPMLISGQRVKLLGRQMFTRDEWNTTMQGSDSRMRMFYSDGRLWVYFTGQHGTGFILPMDESDLSMTKWNPFYGASDILSLAHFEHKKAGHGAITLLASTGLSSAATAYTVSPPSATITATAVYYSRDAILPRPENLSALQVIGIGSGTATLMVTADDVSMGTYTFTFSTSASEERFMRRLPNSRKASLWRYWITSISSGVVIRQVSLATNPGALANV